MKKKALSLLLTLALCLSLLPTAAWATEDEGGSSLAAQSGETHENHCICGAEHHAVGKHTNEETVNWTEWTYTDKLPDTKGNYYLKDNVTISDKSWTPVSGTVLCLNGKTIQANGNFDVIEIDNGYTFTLTDCKNTGTVTHTSGNGSGVYNDGGKFNMYGGSITGNSASIGGGVNNYATRDAIYQYNTYSATFNMYGGSITGNSAVSSGKSDGSGNGGGVYNYTSPAMPGTSQSNVWGTLNMYGGSITNNTAVNGSGVYNWNGDINVTDGSITGNTATSLGGVYLNGGELTVSDSANIINNKKTDEANSNVYLPTSGKITVKSNFDGKVGVTVMKPAAGLVVASPAYGQTLTSDIAGNFSSDDSGYEIQLNNNKLVLAAKPQSSGHTDHYLCNGSSCTHLGGHTENAKTTFTAWNETDKLPDTAGSYYLENNVTLSSTWEPVSGTVLCLNGKTVQAGGDFDAITIGNDVTFTLTDCTNNGKITHADGTTGRGILINGTAVFNMYGGDITRNTSSKEGAGVNALGTFNMYGGSITNNTMDAQYNYSGGGVCVDSVYSGTGEVHTHTFNLYNGRIANNRSYNGGGGITLGTYGELYMHDGSISDNQSSNGGGGVSVSSSNKFVMTGGSITGNICGTKYNGGGVSVYSKDPVFTVSGNVTITGNKRGTETNNVFLHDASYYWGSYISVLGIGDAGLASAARIGITTEIEPTSTKNMPAVFQNDTDYSANFFSDAGHYVVYNSTTKQLELSLTAQGHTHTWNKYVLDPTDHSRVLLYCSDSTCNASGGSVTVKAPTKLTYAGTPPRATVETSADWKGPEAGNITILYVKKLGEGSCTIFNTEPYTGTGTHYAYIRFLNNNNTIVEAHAEYDLVEKNDVTNKITFPSGQLTYTGSGLRYEKATISEGYNGKFTYTYWVPKGGSTGELDADGLPLAVGTYTVIATYEDDENYGTARAILEVVAGSNNNNSASSGGGGGGRTSYPVIELL